MKTASQAGDYYNQVFCTNTILVLYRIARKGGNQTCYFKGDEMDLANLRTISLFLTHLVCVCVHAHVHACAIIDAQRLKKLPHAAGSHAGARCRLSVPALDQVTHSKGCRTNRRPRGALRNCQVSPLLGSRACRGPLLVPGGVRHREIMALQGSTLPSAEPPLKSSLVAQL